MFVPVDRPRNMSESTFASLRRLYEAHQAQREALFAPPATAEDAEPPIPLVFASEDDVAAGASCRICLSRSFPAENAGPPAADGAPDAEALVAPCDCAGTQRFVHAGCLRRWQRQIGRDGAGAMPNPRARSGGGAMRAVACGVCGARFSLKPPRARDVFADVSLGALLVARDAARFSERGGFRRSVVLVLELTPTQAVGVCLGRPLGERGERVGPSWRPVDGDLREAVDAAAGGACAWRRGGPVGGGRCGHPRFVLVRRTGARRSSLQLGDGSFVDATGGLLGGDLAAAAAARGAPLALYRGYVRWGRQQLAQEFEEGNWRVAASTSAHLDPSLAGDDDLWRSLEDPGA